MVIAGGAERYCRKAVGVAAKASRDARQFMTRGGAARKLVGLITHIEP